MVLKNGSNRCSGTKMQGRNYIHRQEDARAQNRTR